MSDSLLFVLCMMDGSLHRLPSPSSFLYNWMELNYLPPLSWLFAHEVPLSNAYTKEPNISITSSSQTYTFMSEIFNDSFLDSLPFLSLTPRVLNSLSPGKNLNGLEHFSLFRSILLGQVVLVIRHKVQRAFNLFCFVPILSNIIVPLPSFS